MATAGEDLQEALIIKETLKDLKEDILSKFDEIIEISSKQIEEINELVKKNVEEVINKHGPAAEKLVQEMCAEACAQVFVLKLFYKILLPEYIFRLSSSNLILKKH